MNNSDQPVIGYKLLPIREPEPGAITTQAVIICDSCSGIIATSGGPQLNSLCLNCVGRFNLLDKLSK